MKKILYSILLLLTLFLVYINKQTIVTYILDHFIYKKSIVTYDINDYYRTYSFNYVSETDDFIVDNKQDIINVLYTVLNNGWDKFTFYCKNNYENCIDDTKELMDDNSLLSNINNFVHPYNSYNTITITYNNLGKITFEIEKLYSESDIQKLNETVNEIIANNISDDMSNYDKIKVIHDYIINNTLYDSDRAYNIANQISNDDATYESNKATGTLFDHMAICSGYSDTMALFLNLFDIPNYKISNDNHVWNLVYLDNEWLHLDLTWDDPVVNTGENMLLYTYFLIDNNELNQKDNDEHSFDSTIFSEATE
ncbi:MAG: hypothetical protein PHE54_01010 [Bacilli bacterium]|nr:hypothetical protein [Bacilli bacterium]